MIGKHAAINDPAAAKKKFELKSRAVNENTVRGFCATYKAELEKARKRKRLIAPNLNNLPRGRLLSFRSNSLKVFIRSLK